MTRWTCSRLCLLACLVAPLAAQPATDKTPPLYAHVATLPDTIGGQPLVTLAFDRAAKRLYAGSNLGLYWVNVDEEHPVWKGPMFRAQITKIEFAPEVGRVFFVTREAVGYVDVAALESPRLIANVHANDIAYEPSRRELYVAYRAPRLQVFDATSGEPSGGIDLPGWWGESLEAIPGRVFLTLPSANGLYAIDAASHHVGPWPVSGKIITPAYLEADPSGRYLFLTYYQNVVAINTSTAKIVGRISSGATPAIAFDPGSNLLVTTFPYSSPPYKVAAYKVDETGFTQVAAMENPSIGLRGVEPTSNGFVQSGVHAFLLWTFSGAR